MTTTEHSQAAMAQAISSSDPLPGDPQTTSAAKEMAIPTGSLLPRLDDQQALYQSVPNEQTPAGLDSESSQICFDSHDPNAVFGSASPPTNGETIPRSKSSVGTTNFLGSHHPNETQVCVAAEDPAKISHDAFDTQKKYADLGPILADPILGIFAEAVDDLEKVRTANQNRLRTLTDTSGRGYGLTIQHPEVMRLAAIVAVLEQAEHDAILNLQRAMRKHPLGLWAKPVVGVGEKQLARLLAAIGDPYWNDLHDRPRMVSELWAYCGYHVIRASIRDHRGLDIQKSRVPDGSSDHTIGHSPGDLQTSCADGVAPKRQRGQKSNWSEDARKRCYLIAESCIKQAKSPYRAVYDDARARYADATHNAECVRCGPRGKPALPGSPLSLGHQHARGLRAVAKEFLKDLWIESRRIHLL